VDFIAIETVAQKTTQPGYLRSGCPLFIHGKWTYTVPFRVNKVSGVQGRMIRDRRARRAGMPSGPRCSRTPSRGNSSRPAPRLMSRPEATARARALARIEGGTPGRWTGFRGGGAARLSAPRAGARGGGRAGIPTGASRAEVLGVERQHFWDHSFVHGGGAAAAVKNRRLRRETVSGR